MTGQNDFYFEILYIMKFEFNIIEGGNCMA